MWKYLVMLCSAATLVAFAIQPAEAGTGGEQPPAGVVKPTPPTTLPHLPASTSQTEQIRQLVQCGNTMYAVGTFSTIRKGSTTYTRNNVFSFQATSPYTVTSWAPNVVGTYGTTSNPSNTVNTIAFVGGNCANAYIGGHFSSVNGTAVKNIAEISTSTGNVVKAFASNASGAVQTMVGTHARLLVGGNFTGINGDNADPYMVSLNPTTGKSDGFLHLNISGNYQFTGVNQNATHVYASQLSHGGRQVLVEGDFTSVGGQARQQAFILNIGGTTGVVTGWNAPEFNTNCAAVEPFYVAGRRVEPGRLDRLLRHHRLSPERAADRQRSAHRAVRRRAGVPVHRFHGQRPVDELHRLRLAVLHRCRQQGRVLRRARALVDEPGRL